MYAHYYCTFNKNRSFTRYFSLVFKFKNGISLHHLLHSYSLSNNMYHVQNPNTRFKNSVKYCLYTLIRLSTSNHNNILHWLTLNFWCIYSSTLWDHRSKSLIIKLFFFQALCTAYTKIRPWLRFIWNLLFGDHIRQ